MTHKSAALESIKPIRIPEPTSTVSKTTRQRLDESSDSDGLSDDHVGSGSGSLIGPMPKSRQKQQTRTLTKKKSEPLKKLELKATDQPQKQASNTTLKFLPKVNVN